MEGWRGWDGETCSCVRMWGLSFWEQWEFAAASKNKGNGMRHGVEYPWHSFVWLTGCLEAIEREVVVDEVVTRLS